MLNAKIVRYSFSQLGKNYVKYTVETFTIDHCLSDRQYDLNEIVLHMHYLVEKSMKK
jgi:hypothetical protein